MMKIEKMRERKRELGYTIKQVSELSGVPLGTVQKVLCGHTKSPRYATIRALEAVLGETPIIIKGAKKMSQAGEVPFLREEALDYEAIEKKPFVEKKQGEYTLEDYFAIPDERRVELIDGVIYDMTAPSTIHQLVTQYLFVKIWTYVMENKGKCIVNIAPTDVHLDTMDNKTMVQPDVLVTCSRDKLTIPRIEGAPDLVIEVLSPSTRRKDISIKGNKYSQAGVREYWMVDPRDRKVIVYDYEHEDIIGMYTFRDSVPVMIFDGKLEIDFSDLSDYLNELLGDEWYER